MCCKAVEACVSWASWALSQHLITPGDLHHVTPSSTKSTKLQRSSAEAHAAIKGVATAQDRYSMSNACPDTLAMLLLDCIVLLGT